VQAECGLLAKLFPEGEAATLPGYALHRLVDTLHRVDNPIDDLRVELCGHLSGPHLSRNADEIPTDALAHPTTCKAANAK